MTRKICVLGTSYVGAVYKAYQTYRPAPGEYDIDFYGHSNGGFPNVEIQDGHFRNVRFRSPAQPVEVRDYDAFVVYGDLPAPHDLAKRINQCVQASASQQLLETLLKDIARGTTAFRLADSLRATAGKPVIMLSGNVVAISKAKMNEALNARMVALFDKALAPHIYLPFPRELFNERFLPDDRYYNGSIKLTGEKADENTGHDYHHMNEQGGLVVLNAIIDRLAHTL